jgi:phosphoribosylformylglycinamidine synthase
VAADYWHVIAQKRALTADERAKLAKLLDRSAGRRRQGRAVSCRAAIGTISPWSSKATDIAFNCDLEPAIERIERVVAFHVVLKQNRALTADEKKTVAACCTTA